MSYKGFFKPLHPEKYKGDPQNIIYRSSWERKLLHYLDECPSVLAYASEEIVIPYRDPFNPNKTRRYFVDFYVEIQTKDGVKKILVEVKPMEQTVPPNIAKKNATPTGRVSRRYANAMKRYMINEAKWEAARSFAKKHNMEFKIMTEYDLGIKR